MKFGHGLAKTRRLGVLPENGVVPSLLQCFCCLIFLLMSCCLSLYLQQKFYETISQNSHLVTVNLVNLLIINPTSKNNVRVTFMERYSGVIFTFNRFLPTKKT